jgi:hypothetical protein
MLLLLLPVPEQSTIQTLVIHALHLRAFCADVALERDIFAWLVDAQATPHGMAGCVH